MTQKKLCSGCNKWRSFDRFGIDKTGIYGLRSQCKDCRNEIERNRHSGIKSTKKPGCPKGLPGWLLKIRKEIRYLIRSERRRTTPELAAKHCESARRYQKNNPERERERNRVRDHERRAKIKTGGRITAAEWRAMKEKYNYTCLCCKKKEPEIELTLDHVKPLCVGGENLITNAQPLCGRCNSSKGTKWIDYRKETR